MSSAFLLLLHVIQLQEFLGKDNKNWQSKKSGGDKVKLNLRRDHQVAFRENVAVLGSAKELGSWKNKLMMNWTQNGWVCNLELENNGQAVEYKFVIVGNDKKEFNMGKCAAALEEAVGASSFVEQWQGIDVSFVRSKDNLDAQKRIKWGSFRARRGCFEISGRWGKPRNHLTGGESRAGLIYRCGEAGGASMESLGGGGCGGSAVRRSKRCNRIFDCFCIIGTEQHYTLPLGIGRTIFNSTTDQDQDALHFAFRNAINGNLN
ncbi:hypothetical protein BUALT_Bualt08G0128400 [Buddleja alternifolia]|uniref:CBM20 domain-containing protein n=1 Tax=Buddleja alternifolia TaxID=168488 RepID=A0AAV6XD37_9LAMI|nr:hypothetical protein BUALT_Bualt08G0128400 [Buddleja alternifolia]